MLSKDDLAGGLSTAIVGKKLFLFETIDSTNSCARALGDAGTAEGAVVVAEYQTNGRGRLGRTWSAEPGTSLLFSTLLRPPITVETAGLLTLFASAAIARAVERSTSLTVECKWPNDLLLGGKKFCGILIENSFQQAGLSYAVIGAGINVNQQEFPEEIAARATSLARETGTSFERNKILLSILSELDSMYTSVRRGEFELAFSEWTKRCGMFGKAITVQEHDSTVSGVAVRLHRDGGLVIRMAEGERTIYAGDVSVLS
jgi:BirA family biotin operon repressor/biotin-[acetyl-CoA-carboxylase] ligase